LKFIIASRRRSYKVRWRILFASDGNIMMKLWLIGLLLLESIREDFTIDEDLLDMAESELHKILNFEYVHVCGLKVDAPSKFSFLKKTVLDLIDMADKVFHRKD
jgi:hypothetical protein